MILYGFFLLSIVFAAAQENPQSPRVKVCIQEGRVMSLEPREDDEILTRDCSDLRWEYSQNSYDSLYLHRRKITGFEKGWYRLQGYEFRMLDLSYNDISEITSEMLNDLPESLKEVSLRNNKIGSLRRGTIENEHLTSLRLSYNSIDEIESGALENTPRLTFLNLCQNRLSNTEFAATLPPNLLQLWLNSNTITEISAGSFLNLSELRTLTLEGNKITEIQHQAFEGLKKLSYLDLGRNPIEKVAKDPFDFNPLRKTIRINNDQREMFGL